MGVPTLDETGRLITTPSGLTEKLLISAAKAGCHLAYTELQRRQGSRVYAAVRRITKNHEDAEDVVQETWIRGFVHIASFDERAAFSTWITRIAINSALMLIRRRKWHIESSTDEEIDSGLSTRLQLKALTPDPEEYLLALERRSRFQEAVRTLPIELRKVTEQRMFKDYSLKELALTAGITVPAVKSRLSRAKRKLTSSLKSR